MRCAGCGLEAPPLLHRHTRRLRIFGDNVEDYLGHFQYLVFYLLSGFAAAITHVLLNANSRVPILGASGAIAGVLGAYLILHPRSNVVVFIWIIIIVRLVTVPAVILLGLWFLLQLVSATSAAPGEPGVAFWAHVGGFIAGMVLVLVLRRPGTRMLQPSRTLSFQIARPRDARERFGSGSVPSAGRRPGSWRSPWS